MPPQKPVITEEKLEERVKFERLITDITATLVSVPHEQLDGAIDSALVQICRLFGADHCGLVEIPADGSPSHYVSLTDRKERQQKGMSVDIMSGHPWSHHRLVERREPVVFSSLDVLPPEAGVDRASWKGEETQAALALPLHISGRVTHVIGLRSHTSGHEWPASHVDRLRVLGEILVHILAGKRAHDLLQRSERALALAQRVARLGSWEWDVRAGTHHWSDEFYRIFGLRPQESRATYEAFLERVHPGDRLAVDQANRESLSDPDKPYSIEYRITRPDDTERAVLARAEVLFDNARKPLRMIGTLQDITERKRAEEELRKAFEEIGRLKDLVESENVYLREEMHLGTGFAGIIGDSNPIKYVKYRIQQVARSRTTVLLTGETGTGKGLFARALHEASDCKDRLFVNVNCAGLPATLIESELFGSEKGAYTGSTARQIGRFELADGGTLFLDEIGELPLNLQSKLLKVIEEGEFERVGSPHPVKVNVRIIASTNRYLEEEVRKGKFRMDLFYRLNVFPITVPPLRQRREDIPLLARIFVDRYGKRHAKKIERISRQTMAALESYEWPGNVRELMNVIERAVIISEGPELHLAEQLNTSLAGLARNDREAVAGAQEPRGLSEVEREHILRILKETGWRIEGSRGAARLLGMNSSTMRARMKKLHIQRPRSP